MAHGPVDAHLLVGMYDLTPDTFALEDMVESVVEEVHPFGVNMEAHKPIGLGRGTLDAGDGLYDDATGRIVEALQEKGETSQLVAWGLAGVGIGAPVTFVDGTFAATWKRIANLDALTKARAQYALSGAIYSGRLLHGLTARTADGNSQASSVDNHTSPELTAIPVVESSEADPTIIETTVPHGYVDGDVVVFSDHDGSTPDLNGGHGYAVTVIDPTHFSVPEEVTTGGTGGTVKKVSSTGGAMRLHVPALTLGGYDDVLVRLLHSDDKSTFTLKQAFAVVTATEGTRTQQVALTGAIKRYTAIDWDFEGSGSDASVIPYVALHRNP